ncbi:hypothetical protein EYF80_056943 [Liparis tanakae]|uniref:Uncharacterized protein n=1 Tax=Liparis tanakae TaxID=230148 RepID=A0A4Z2EVK1_9TELE|nr:hypothetical protein EYF80_056943 [Liparis tanakae]
MPEPEMSNSRSLTSWKGVRSSRDGCRANTLPQNAESHGSMTASALQTEKEVMLVVRQPDGEQHAGPELHEALVKLLGHKVEPKRERRSNVSVKPRVREEHLKASLGVGRVPQAQRGAVHPPQRAGGERPLEEKPPEDLEEVEMGRTGEQVNRPPPPGPVPRDSNRHTHHVVVVQRQHPDPQPPPLRLAADPLGRVLGRAGLAPVQDQQAGR